MAWCLILWKGKLWYSIWRIQLQLLHLNLTFSDSIWHWVTLKGHIFQSSLFLVSQKVDIPASAQWLRRRAEWRISPWHGFESHHRLMPKSEYDMKMSCGQNRTYVDVSNSNYCTMSTNKDIYLGPCYYWTLIGSYENPPAPLDITVTLTDNI